MTAGLPLLTLLFSGCLENTSGDPRSLDPRFTQGSPGGGLDGGAGAQDQTPFAAVEGERVTFRGVVSSELKHMVDIDFRQRDSDVEGGRRDLGKLALQQPGEFELEVPVGFGKVLLEAFQDVGGDGPTSDDPYGWVEAEIGEEAVEGVALVLVVGGLDDARKELTSADGGLAWEKVEGPKVTVSFEVVSGLVEPIEVDLRDVQDAGVGKLSLSEPGSIEFQVPQGYGELRIQAFQDLTGDGPSDEDPFGWLVLEVADVDLEGISLELVEGGKLALADALGHDMGKAPGLFDDHEGETVVLSGTLSGVAEGTVDLDLRRIDPEAEGGNVYMGKLAIKNPGPFDLQVPEGLGKVMIEAFQDVGGDGPSSDDPYAVVEIEVGDEPVKGVDLVLKVGAMSRAGSRLTWEDEKGPRVTVSLQVVSPLGRPIDVDLRDSTDGGVGKLALSEPGVLRFQVPENYGELRVQAFQDLTSDGPSDDDPFGWLVLEVGDTDLEGSSLDLVEGGKLALAEFLGHAQDKPAGPFDDHQGKMVVISGTLAGVEAGSVDLDLRLMDPEAPGGQSYIGKFVEAGSGSFSLSVPESLGTLSIQAFQDQTGDGPTDDDPFGSLEVEVADVAMSGLVLTLTVGGKARLASSMGHGDGEGAQSSPFSDHEGSWTTVSGSLSGVVDGQVDVDLRVPDVSAEGGNRQLGKLMLAVTGGQYEIRVPQGLGPLMLEVFQDQTGDGPSVDDPYAAATLSIGEVSTVSQDLALVVGARGTPGSGGGQPSGPSGGGTVFSDLGTDPVMVSGTVDLSSAVLEVVGKIQIDLDVFSQAPDSEAGRTLAGKLKVNPNSPGFRFQVPRDAGLLELEAYVDVDGDGPTPGDPFGLCTQNPVRVAEDDVGNLLIRLDLTSVPVDDG